MSDLIIRPSMKFVRLGYWTTIIIFLVFVFLYVNGYLAVPAWVLILPALPILWPLKHQIQQRFTTITIAGDKLRYESGMLSKSMRTMQISKVQDVRVDQKPLQRLFGIGDISIETAGEASRLTMRNVDDPQAVADAISDATHETTPKPAKKK